MRSLLKQAPNFDLSAPKFENQEEFDLKKG